MNKDLTTGKPEKVLWQFCLPLFGSIIFQQLYNIADSFVAGKFISDNALAAVGNSYEITLIFIAFAFGCNIACSVLAALFFGAKQYNDLKTTVYTALISSCVICAALMLVGTLCCDSLLRLIKTPEEVFADSKLYLDIYIYGLPFVFLYNVATGIFSALGDSKTPFIFLACSSTSNIAVDILFVTAFNMGVAGVAWATFLCQGISCVLALVVVFRRFAKIPTEGKVKIFSWNHFGRFAVIAIPSILQQSFISVGNIIIQSVINSFGAAVMAGYSAAVKLNNMVITSLTTLGNGISNYTAQNLGASKYDRIKSGFRAGIKLVWALCVPLVALYVFAGQPLVHIFLESPTGQAMDTGVAFLRIIAPFYFIVSAKLVSDGVLRGAGLMKKFMIATFTDLVLRVALAEVLSRTAEMPPYCSTARRSRGWRTPASCSAASMARRSAAQKMSEQKKASVPNHNVPKKLRIGDSVKVISMNLKGTVHSLPNARGDLYVQMGILRSLVNINDLILLEEDAAPGTKKFQKTSAGKIKMSKSASVSTEINLIGKTTDEAIPLLDKYLAHLPSVRIVHGKGTGALRNAVQAHLKRLKYVKSFHLGEFGEGDAGVTIAEFKD